MGVYIKGMEMPKACYKCELYESETYWCRGAKRDVEDPFADDGVATFCPLVTVPPHGRLIDADALMLRVDMHGTNKFGMLDEDIREFINAAHTIIEAEEGET